MRPCLLLPTCTMHSSGVVLKPMNKMRLGWRTRASMMTSATKRSMVLASCASSRLIATTVPWEAGGAGQQGRNELACGDLGPGCSPSNRKKHFRPSPAGNQSRLCPQCGLCAAAQHQAPNTPHRRALKEAAPRICR